MTRTSAATLALAAALPAAAAAGEAVTYQADGRDFEGYVAKADSPKGAVILIHDWDGLTDYEKKRADMLAELGYSAFAIDLFGAGVRPDTNEGRQAETGKLNNDRALMRTLLEAGRTAAKDQGLGDAVLVGYCFGGGAALEDMRVQPAGITGYAVFHASLTTPEGQTFDAAKAPLRVYHGGADQNPDMATFGAFVTQIEAAKVPYKAEVYAGAPHAFTVFGSERYHEEADRRSWADFTAFLGEVFPN